MTIVLFCKQQEIQCEAGRISRSARQPVVTAAFLFLSAPAGLARAMPTGVCSNAMIHGASHEAAGRIHQKCISRDSTRAAGLLWPVGHIVAVAAADGFQETSCPPVAGFRAALVPVGASDVRGSCRTCRRAGLRQGPVCRQSCFMARYCRIG